MRIQRSLPVVLLAALTLSSPATAQTSAEPDETARSLVSRYFAKMILQDAQIDAYSVAALRADWPTDVKVALALDPSNEKRLASQVDSLKTQLPILSERIKNPLYVESWMRNRLSEMRDGDLQGSSDTQELQLNDAAAARSSDTIRARTRLRAAVGDQLTGFEQAFRTAVGAVLTKNPDLKVSLSALKPESRAIVDSRNRLKAALADAEKRAGR